MTDKLPQDVHAMLGKQLYHQRADICADRNSIRQFCAATENANPIFWDTASAEQISGNEIAPTTMLSSWSRPDRWVPGESQAIQALQIHFDLKRLLNYPTAIVSSIESIFHQPVILGDQIHSFQLLKSISDIKQTKLGEGRFWSIEMHYFNQHEQLLGIDTYQCLGYHKAVAEA